MDIKNKLAVVTGAGSGIGRALAVKLASEGARKVVCTDLDEVSANETQQLIGNYATAVKLDVADQSAITTLVEKLEADSGGIDIFISNAGYAKGGGLGIAAADWKQMMEVHMWAHLYAAQAVVPHMLKRGSGYLLNTSSAAGLLTQIDSAPYAVSKHASVAFAEWLAINYQSRGIGVSVLCPQAVKTNILGKRSRKPGESKKNQAAVDGILAPEKVADDCIRAIQEEQFLVLPHPEVERYFQNKANDYERWLNGMRRFRDRLMGSPTEKN